MSPDDTSEETAPRRQFELVEGEWQGVLEGFGRPFRIVLCLTRTAGGGLFGLVALPDFPVGPYLFTDLEPVDGQLDLTVSPLGLAISAALPFDPAAEMKCLLRLDNTRQHHNAREVELTLLREHPEFSGLDLPRRLPDGGRKMRYRYAVPRQLDDGWVVGEASSDVIDKDGLERLVHLILGGFYPAVHSILIVRRGRLIVEEYFYATDDTRHELASVTKSITSVLFGIARDLGFINDLDTPISEYFPESRHLIALRHVLSMSAGLAWNEMLPQTDQRNDNNRMRASPDWVSFVLDRPLEATPGESFSYSSGLSMVLGEVIHRATRTHVDDFARQHLFEPLGIEEFNWEVGPNAIRDCGGGLSLRPRDLAKIGQIMLNKGTWRSTRIVSEQWVSESLDTQSREPTTSVPGWWPEYGYQWWLRTFHTDGGELELWAARGYGGQCILGIPELECVVVLTGGSYGRTQEVVNQIIESQLIPALLV